MLAGFWRPEIWHPLSIHFPIALLLFSTIALLVSLFFKEPNRRPVENAARLLLFCGCIAAWVAIYTGNLADGIVARKICDPTVLKNHQVAGQTMTYLFTGASVLNILIMTNILNLKLKKTSVYLSLFLMLIGSGYLIQTSHLGASLVYEQGAGVNNHTVDCEGYK